MRLCNLRQQPEIKQRCFIGGGLLWQKTGDLKWITETMT